MSSDIEMLLWIRKRFRRTRHRPEGWNDWQVVSGRVIVSHHDSEELANCAADVLRADWARLRKRKKIQSLPAALQCSKPDEPCDCPSGCCIHAMMIPQTCPKCGITADAFMCHEPGCPVNG